MFNISDTVGARATVVGSGPNGLTAAAILATRGWSVDIYEASSRPGGAASSISLFGEGTTVDIGAAAHPFGVVSPAFKELDLLNHGLTWCYSPYPMAHPLEGTDAVLLEHSVEATAERLGVDNRVWHQVHGHVAQNIGKHLANILGPTVRWPKFPLEMAKFGVLAAFPSEQLAKGLFKEERSRALFVGSSVHSISPPSKMFTAAFGILFGSLGMTGGWPIAKGGTGAIIDSLIRVVKKHGGKIHYNSSVNDLRELPHSDAIILNLTAGQVSKIQGLDTPYSVQRRLEHWRYGTAVFKVDYLLDGPIPWSDHEVGQATTVHVCGTTSEIDRAERLASRGILPDRPFVMVSQQQIADSSRGSPGKHVISTYAHVPNNYIEDYKGQVAKLIENQIERFAPHFRDRIISKVETSPQELELLNPNLVGGDIAGGAMHAKQILFRPGITNKPYKLNSNIYMASSSTPPGAGVHGMPGYWAAQAAIEDLRRNSS